MVEYNLNRTGFPIDKFSNPIGTLSVETGNSLSGDVDGSNGSTQSSTFSNGEIVMLTPTDADARVEIGTNPTASSSSWFLPQGMPRVIYVKSGNKIAVNNANVNVEVLR